MKARVGFLSAVILVLARAAAAQTTAPTGFEALGREIEAALNARDGVALNRLVDADAFGRRLFEGVTVPAILQLRDQGRPMIDAMLGTVASALPPSRIRLLRHRRVDGEDRLLLRLSGEDELNYWDCIVEPRRPGDVGPPRIGDVHLALSGERLSSTLRRVFLTLAPASADAPTQQERDDLRAFRDFAVAARAGEPAEILRRYDALPERLRTARDPMLLRVLAASRRPATAGLAIEAAGEFRRRFGDEPAIDLMLMSPLVDRGEWAAAEACVDRVDDWTGGDAMLDGIRATIRRQAGDPAAARRLALGALKREPDLIEAAQCLIVLAVDQGDFAGARRLLTAIESMSTRPYRVPEAYLQAPAFAAFRESADYRQWATQRPKATSRPAQAPGR